MCALRFAGSITTTLALAMVCVWSASTFANGAEVKVLKLDVYPASQPTEWRTNKLKNNGTSRDSAALPSLSTIRLAQSSLDLSSTGNPSIVPMKWSGLLLNEKIFERDGKIFHDSCTAQFISPKVLVTAAHCVQNNETGAWYDLNKMYFLLQYQNHESSQVYRPVCLSRFDGWTTELNDSKGKTKVWQWDYAMILVDRPSTTGHFNWTVDWKEKYRRATATGYPNELMSGQIIQIAPGELKGTDIENEMAMEHKRAELTQGSSGGAWVANLSKEEDADHNVIISVSSFVIKKLPGISFGPYLTADFKSLFDYVGRGCPVGLRPVGQKGEEPYTAKVGDKQVTSITRSAIKGGGRSREELLKAARESVPINVVPSGPVGDIKLR